MLGIFAYALSRAPSDVWQKIKEPVTKQDVLLVVGFLAIMGWAVVSALGRKLSEIADRLQTL